MICPHFSWLKHVKTLYPSCFYIPSPSRISYDFPFYPHYITYFCYQSALLEYPLEIKHGSVGSVIVRWFSHIHAIILCHKWLFPFKSPFYGWCSHWNLRLWRTSQPWLITGGYSGCSSGSTLPSARPAAVSMFDTFLLHYMCMNTYTVYMYIPLSLSLYIYVYIYTHGYILDE